MNRTITKVAIRYEHDVVLARQRARQIAALLGFDNQDQVRIATAVSEIVRNAFRYAKEGMAEFRLETSPPPGTLRVVISDQGPGIPHLQEILEGEYVSTTGMGMGILGARKLMDDFQITSDKSGTIVTLAKELPRRAGNASAIRVAEVAGALARQPPQDPFEELQRQNQELLSALHEVQRQKTQLAQLNRELEDTNRGVVALYAELDERADYLRRASELKTQFLSNMTHEFRTPLNSILSLSRILLDRIDGDLGVEQERQIKFIQQGAQELSELVNDLLDLAKVEAGKVKIEAAEFEVEDLFGALRGMLRPLLAHNSAVNLVFEDASELPPLVTDESKVSQVLRNLISNALKFTERGEVRVRATLNKEDWVALSVTDTGIGIALEDQDRIFEEFTQLEGPHQKGKRGTGLGLPLSRKLAELLGGSLTVSSKPGEGSTFTLHAPCKYAGPGVVSFAPEVTTELDPTRYPVLIVEDNRETLFIYDKYLKGTGFQPLPAQTLKQARHALLQFRPIAVILDVMLAHENTWAFLADFKHNPSTHNVPVIVITVVENEHKAIAMGADAFHSKPVDRAWLLRKLEDLALKTRSEEALIIDDDEASRYILKGFLSGTRFRALEADNGALGLTLARERKPAVIFLDLIMPGLQGAEVLEALKADPETKDIPVVIHTGKKLTAHEHKKLQRSAVSIIPKNHEDRQASAREIHAALVQASPSASWGSTQETL
jgi:signal transduction histidine kinase/CheY-like chemotaxis protein